MTTAIVTKRLAATVVASWLWLAVSANLQTGAAAVAGDTAEAAWQIEGRSDPRYMELLSWVAKINRLVGDYSAAESALKEQARIRERTLGPDEPELSGDFLAIGWLCVEQDKLADAEIYYRHALSLLEKRFGRNHIDTTPALNSLAGLYRRQGRYADSEFLYNRALMISMRQLDPDDARVAVGLSELAELQRQRGNLDTAGLYLDYALHILNTNYSADHPDVVRIRLTYESLQRERTEQHERVAAER